MVTVTVTHRHSYIQDGRGGRWTAPGLLSVSAPREGGGRLERGGMNELMDPSPEPPGARRIAGVCPLIRGRRIAQVESIEWIAERGN